MPEPPPLAWGKIVLCAVSSVAISFTLLWIAVGQLPSSGGLQSFFDAFFSAYVLVAGCFVLAPIVAFLLCLGVVRERRAAHTALAAVISLPVVYLAIWLVGRIG